MRNIMIFAAVMAGLGTFMAQIADRMTPALASSVPHQAAPVGDGRPMASASGRTLNIPHDARGHFAPKAGSRDSASASWSIPAPP